MEIYIQKFGSQPINEQQVLQFLNSGELSPKDLACVRGMQEWKPIWELSELPQKVKDGFTMGLEIQILQLKQRTWQSYENNLLLRKEFEEGLAGWEETVNEYDEKYPETPLTSGRTLLYYYQALLKIKSNAFMRFENEDNPIIGSIVLSQKENANEAVELLDKALELNNSPQYHLLKFEPLFYLECFDEIDEITDYVLENFSNDEVACKEALRQKRIIENVFD